MYVKRHKVRRGDKEYVYLRLVESFRDEQGRVRHRLLHQLGREDELNAYAQPDCASGTDEHLRLLATLPRLNTVHADGTFVIQ